MDENIQQVFQQLSEEMRALGEAVAVNSQVRMSSMKQEDIERLKNVDSLNRSTQSVNQNVAAVDRSSQVYKANVKAAEEYDKAMKNFAASLDGSAQAVKKMFNNMVSQDPSRSMAKYNDGLSQMGDAVSKAAENFGPLGKAIGFTVQAITKVSGLYLQQADNLLKANDSIAQFGTAGSFTSKQLLDMAHGAGVTSKNMDVLVKPIQSLGPALTNLGASTGDGVKAFTAMAKVTNEQREGFQRLGVSQEQLMQNQADYVKLQSLSGRSLQSELKDKAALQRASLEYTENLLTLSNISGMDAESAKKKQQEAARAVEAQVAQIQLESKARRLDNEGRKDEAALIRKEAKGRQDAIAALSVTGDANLMKGVREFLSTGTMVGEEAQALGRLGLSDELAKLKSGIAAGGDAQKLTAEFQDKYNKAMVNAVDKVGFAASRSGEVAKAFNFNEESLANVNKQRDTNLANETEESRKRIQEAKKPGKDPAQDARAKMTTVEIEAGKAFDKLIASGNVLVSGFNASTIAMGLFTGAVAVATGMLTKQLGTNLLKSGAGAVANAAKGLMGGVAPIASTVATAAAPVATTAATAATAAAPVAATAATGATGAAGAATTAATALSKLAGPLAGLSKAAPLIGTVMSVGSGVVDAYQGIKKADKDLSEGKITKQEARVEKGEAVGGGAGTAAGGAGGAWAGAAAGAAVGSVVPVVGTAIGGIIGAALGGWLGSKAGKAVGEVAGGSIAKMTSDADKKVDEVAKKADAKKVTAKDEASSQDKRSKPEEGNKVLVVNTTPIPVAIVKGMDNLASLKPMAASMSESLPKPVLPKAAVGGVFEGPKSGYPVELHGKEMIVPMGGKTASLPAPPVVNDDDEDALEEEREALMQLKSTLNDTDGVFKKLSTSITKLDDIQETKLEKEEDASKDLLGVQGKLKSVFDNAVFDLGKFSNKIKVVTQETGSGTGVKPADIGGILGGSAGTSSGSSSSGTGLKPPSAPSMASMGGGTGITPPVKQDVKQNLGDVKAALMKRGMGDEKYLNAVLGNVMKESGGKVLNENLNYGKTDNNRIRSIFGSRAKGKSDEELNAIKSSPESMGEFMYGKDTKIGQSMGNLEPGDGFKYRGRGYIQLTGKANYAAASQAIFGDDTLVKNPDLVNDPKIAADVVAWYMEKGKSRMAKAMGIDDKNMTQEQANLLATSQIAGGDVRKKGDYLAGEVMNKVTNYAASKDIQGIEPSKGTMVASADTKKSDIPKAQKGGVFEGPDSGYLVELHGPETVIPNDKIASIAKKELESVVKMSDNVTTGGDTAMPSIDTDGIAKKSIKLFSDEMGPTFAGMNEFTGYNAGPMSTDMKAMQGMASKIGAYDEKSQTITDTDSWKKLLHSGIATNYDMGPATVGTEQFGPDAGNVLGDRLKEIMDNDKTSLTDAIKQLQEEFKAATQQMVQQLAESAAAPTVEGGGEDVMAEVAKSMTELVNKMSESNDIQGKILQYSQV